MPKNRANLLLCLTGGGTAGHVTPHFALLPSIKAKGWEVFYIGSNGLEKPLVEAQGIENLSLAFFKQGDLGNDGVWDVCSDQEVCDIAMKGRSSKLSAQRVAKMIVDTCISKETTDNVSVICAYLQ